MDDDYEITFAPDGTRYSVSQYAGDGLWYAIAKRGEGDIGIRCRHVDRQKAIDMVKRRVKQVPTGPLFGRV